VDDDSPPTAAPTPAPPEEEEFRYSPFEMWVPGDRTLSAMSKYNPQVTTQPF